jgi:hypothetical protein
MDNIIRVIVQIYKYKSLYSTTVEKTFTKYYYICRHTTII